MTKPMSKKALQKELAEKVAEQQETTQSLYWQLLRALEEKCGNSAGALDAQLIRCSYRHLSALEGRTIDPVYVDRHLRETPP